MAYCIIESNARMLRPLWLRPQRELCGWNVQTNFERPLTGKLFNFLIICCRRCRRKLRMYIYIVLSIRLCWAKTFNFDTRDAIRYCILPLSHITYPHTQTHTQTYSNYMKLRKALECVDDDDNDDSVLYLVSRLLLWHVGTFVWCSLLSMRYFSSHR